MILYWRRSRRFLAFPVAQRFAPLTGWRYSEKFQKEKIFLNTTWAYANPKLKLRKKETPN